MEEIIMNKELKNKLTDIANSVVTEQEINTIGFYRITLSDNTKYIVGIWKDRDKYKISLNVLDSEKIVKRSNKDVDKIVLAISGMLKQLTLETN